MTTRSAMGVATLVLLGAAAACGSAEQPKAKPPMAPIGTVMGVPSGNVPAAGSAQPTPQERANARENRIIALALTKVEATRGLKSRSPVPGHVLTREEMIAKVKAHVAKEVPDEAIVREGRILQLFGLVPQDLDYKAAMFALLEEQLAGFYEPEDGTMYMAADLDGDMADATLFHELVHALQDQHWDLKAQSKYRPGESDLSFARSALAEGDATSSMLDPILAKSGMSVLDIPDDQTEKLILGAASAAGPKTTPSIMQRSLVAPYATGLRFVNALRRKGGWEAVNEVWKAPPTTSEQILHMDKYRAHEAPIAVRSLTAAALGTGFEKKDEDSSGELGFALLFDEITKAKGPARGREAAKDWGGDRVTFFQKGDEVALATRLQFDPSGGKHGARSFDIVKKGFEDMLGKAKQSSEGFVCFERPELGPLTIARKGDTMVVTAGPTKVTQKAWASAGSCAVAAKWSKELGE